MATFHLDIVTPDGEFFNGDAEKVIVRTIAGDVCILAHHTEYMTALGLGQARITVDDKERKAACIDGMLTVSNGAVKILATTFEWSENIDIDRATKAKEAAQAAIAQGKLDGQALEFHQIRLKRALVRLGAK